MKTHFSFKHLLFIGGAVLYSMQISAVKNPVDYVSTLVGTQSKFELSTGNTYPATALPWGMNFWTPQTGKMGDGWAYTYDADKIRGFKQTHQPSPWMNDYGQFSIMPITGGLVFDQDQRASWFSHKAEVAKPYYYKVYLADHDVTTELVPTERAVMFRFTYPETKNAYVVIDAFDKGSYVKVIPEENKIIGYSTKNSGGVPENFKNYFVIQFDKPFTFTSGVKENNILPNETEVQGNHTGAIIGFATQKGEIVHARVASSFISYEQAELNLKELGKDSFDQLVTKGKDIWNREMSKVDVEDDNIDNLRTFYSCLYRSMLFPRSFYEIDAKGQVVHYSPYNGKVLPGYMFTDTGFWDTFRCLFPFLNLMYPSMNQKMQEGLVNAYLESGFLPEWASPGHRDCMVGNNSASVVADAYIKGLRGYDIETLWEALKHDANAHLRGTASGRLAYDAYNKLGYVPNNIGIGQNVARTLEYAYNDWTIYTLGKKLGKPASEIDIFKQRALNMIHEMREMQVMNMGQYAHGNQPIQHMVYLYNYSSEPWKAQYWIREIMNKLYTAGPDGYCGDEDNGQTSAWYVFSALGFYPVCPGTDEYIIGTPLFKSAKLHLENGKTITIKADNNQLDNRYIKEMKVNGKSQTRNFLTHDQLIKGANIQFQMSPVPNKQRGTTEKDVPYSLSFE